MFIRPQLVPGGAATHVGTENITAFLLAASVVHRALVLVCGKRRGMMHRISGDVRGAITPKLIIIRNFRAKTEKVLKKVPKSDISKWFFKRVSVGGV